MTNQGALECNPAAASKAERVPGRIGLGRTKWVGSGCHQFVVSEENADAYGCETYPEVLKTLGKVVRGTPEVHTREVSFSTFNNIAAHAAS